MSPDSLAPHPPGQSFHVPARRSEWLADTVVHVLGVAFGLGATITLAIVALPHAEALRLVSLGLYAAGLLTMLGCSALYNVAINARHRALLRRLDHAAIFVMIAGTYSPFSLIMIGGAWGLGLFLFVWTVALGGVALKMIWPNRFERLSVAAYLLLGWTIVVALDPLFANVPLPTIILLGVGGLIYSVGVLFHLWRRLPYHNAIWHACVLAAAVCHFAAILRSVALA